MRCLAGLRFVLVAAALIGLLGGRSIILPVAVAHAAMVMATVDSGHDCCGKTSNTSADKADLAGTCLGPGCSMTAPAVLPAAPAAIAFSVERTADRLTAVAGLEGRSPPPLLEPPRA